MSVVNLNNTAIYSVSSDSYYNLSFAGCIDDKKVRISNKSLFPDEFIPPRQKSLGEVLGERVVLPLLNNIGSILSRFKNLDPFVFPSASAKNTGNSHGKRDLGPSRGQMKTEERPSVAHHFSSVFPPSPTSPTVQIPQRLPQIPERLPTTINPSPSRGQIKTEERASVAHHFSSVFPPSPTSPTVQIPERPPKIPERLPPSVQPKQVTHLNPIVIDYSRPGMKDLYGDGIQKGVAATQEFFKAIDLNPNLKGLGNHFARGLQIIDSTIQLAGSLEEHKGANFVNELVCGAVGVGASVTYSAAAGGAGGAFGGRLALMLKIGKFTPLGRIVGAVAGVCVSTKESTDFGNKIESGCLILLDNLDAMGKEM